MNSHSLTLVSLALLLVLISNDGSSLSVSAYPVSSSQDESSESSEVATKEAWLRHQAALMHMRQQENSELAALENDEETFNRASRSVSVFNRIYHKCRNEKRKDQKLCLYLANLYHNVKGFHGIV